MAKELPYFKFEPAEYLTKDISFCSLSAQVPKSHYERLKTILDYELDKLKIKK